MLVRRKSAFTGKINEMELNCTDEQLDRYFNGNEAIQDVFPHLNADEREFIKTGCSVEEWNTIFGEEEDE